VAGRAQPLGDRKQPALGHGHSVSDDECRVRTDHAPVNITTIKHMGLNLVRISAREDSLRLRRKVLAWDEKFNAGIVTW